MITIKLADPTDKDFRKLISRLNAELGEKYGELQKKYDQYNLIREYDTVVLAYDNGNAVGCGCFKKFNEESAEIKRMFVQKEFRGRGISKLMLTKLEQLAKAEGYSIALLETVTKQMEAIGLYKGSGYQKIENYGQYAGMNSSICMVKELINI